MGSASRRQLRRSSRRGKWGFSSKDRKESNSTEARTENAGVRINLLMHLVMGE